MTDQSIPGTTWVAERLERALQGDDPVVRMRAAEALGHMRGEGLGAVPALARTSLTDMDSGVRAAVVNALTEIGASADDLLENAVELLKHPDKTVRARAGWAIGKLDPAVAARAIPALSECLATDAAIDGRFGAAWAFGRLRSPSIEAIESLKRALRDPAADVRAEAARALGRTGRPAAGTLPTLVTLLTDADPLVREQAAGALGRINENTPEAIEALRTLTTDPVDYVREAASEALTRFGEQAKPGPPRLDEDAWVAQAPSVSELAGRLLEADDSGRAEAAWLLAKLGTHAGGSTTEQLVIQALVDRDSDARWSALCTIARIATRSREVTRATLRVLAYDRDPDVRDAAAAALGALWPEAREEAVTGLIGALGDEDALVREDAAEALGAMGMAAASARDALGRALEDPHGGVRARAAESPSIIALSE